MVGKYFKNLDENTIWECIDENEKLVWLKNGEWKWQYTKKNLFKDFKEVKVIE